MRTANDQRLSALERANEIRSARAQLKRDLRAGRVDFASILIDPPDWLMSARVFDIALSIPRAGRTKVQAAFRMVMISTAKTFANLQPQQSQKLTEALRSWPSLRDRIGKAA